MKIIITKTILLSVGLIFLIWFSIPIFTHKIINIGNVTGIFISAILITYPIFFKQINKFIVNFWYFTYGKIILSIISLIICTIIIFSIIASVSVISSILNTNNNNNTLIVLGCRVYGTKASLMLTERLDSAYTYLENNDKAVCILSGGQGKGEDISEALCMYKYLLNKGINSSRLYIEDRSTSTRENIYYSRKIIEEKNLDKNVSISTNEFHLYRASKISQKEGLKVNSVPAKTAWWLFPTYFMRELFGIMYQWFL